MHLYQYLPGKFKATTSPPQKLDALDLTTSTTKSSVLTPKQKNVKVKPQNNNMPQKTKTEAFQPSSPQKEPSKKANLLKDTLPTNVGPGCSNDTVVSDVTTPTTLTYPKIGPGYSDTISVTSDLTIPTVMPGEAQSEVVQQAQIESLLDQKWTWTDGRAKSTPRNTGSSRRKQVSFNENGAGGKGERRSSKQRKSSKSRDGAAIHRKHRSNSHEDVKDLENRLDRLRVKSIEGSHDSSPKGLDRRTSLAASCPARLGLAAGESPKSGNSKKMEDVLWDTLQTLLEKEYSEDFCEEEKETSHSSRGGARRKHRSISPSGAARMKRSHGSRKQRDAAPIVTRSG